MTNQANTTPAVVAVKPETKMDKARAVFASMAGAQRKDVLAAFREQIGLSDACAATYYQNLKARAGKAAAPVAEPTLPPTELAADEGTGACVEMAADEGGSEDSVTSTETIIEPEQEAA